MSRDLHKHTVKQLYRPIQEKYTIFQKVSLAFKAAQQKRNPDLMKVKT